MKIVNTKAGQAYHLTPGTQLEIERPNLFFNEWGEQSLPTDLPDTDLNRQLTNYPDMLSNRRKPETIECSIQSGEYSMPCRQAILSAKRREKISTSFYMNEGAFLAKISDISLKDIFGDEVIPGITTVTEGIEFCRSLVNGTHSDYAIFPVLIDNGGSSYKILNQYGYIGDNGDFHNGLFAGKNSDFYHAVSRSETVDDTVISVSPGFYITPFIRANYLLKRIFEYFGYILLDNFFTRTSPFPDMVFINTCADTLVNGSIKITDLLPDCSCDVILEVFRKKFMCEFVPDEVRRTVQVKLFKDCLNEEPTTDLSPYLTSYPEVSFPEFYQQIALASEHVLSDDGSVTSESSLLDLAAKYPSIDYNPTTGTFTRTGFQYAGYNPLFGPQFYSLKDIVSPSSMPYLEGIGLKVKEVNIPDMQPEFRGSINLYLSGTLVTVGFLLVGTPVFLNSKIVKSGETSDSKTDTETNVDNTGLKPMLAFAYRYKGYPMGTVTNYRITTDYSEDCRLYDYSLCYNGPDGLYERFYRSYDDLLRNSLHAVKVELLIPENLKLSLPAHLPVLLENQKMLIDRIIYQIGGENEPLESELLTVNLYEPVSSAKKFDEIIPTQKYKWKIKASHSAISEQEYASSPYKELTFDTIYPQIKPSEELVSPEKRFYERTTCLSYGGLNGGIKYVRVNYWLVCEAVTT